MSDLIAQFKEGSEGSEDSWVRIIEDGQTVALVRLPLSISRISGISQSWPKAFLSESKTLVGSMIDIAAEGSGVGSPSDGPLPRKLVEGWALPPHIDGQCSPNCFGYVYQAVADKDGWHLYADCECGALPHVDIDWPFADGDTAVPADFDLLGFDVVDKA